MTAEGSGVKPHEYKREWFPSEDVEQVRFVRAYLGYDFADGAKLTAEQDAAVESLRLEVLAYVPATHAHWGLWGIIQSVTAVGIDYDFEGYTRQRLGKLWGK
jgi:hypothetical protein